MNLKNEPAYFGARLFQHKYHLYCFKFLQMKSLLFLSIFFSFFVLESCTIQNREVKNKETKDYNNESFSQFFKRFEKDSLFQKSRIDKPITQLTYSENDDFSERIEESFITIDRVISFKPKDWSEYGITLKPETVSSDTMKMIIIGNDTGLYFEYYFVKRNGQWFLCKVEDKST
jgi:hypothetical protein